MMAEVSSVELPTSNAQGFYELRFESIGGLGAHLAGQILAEAAVLDMGLNGSQFSSYGSEKRGTPVKSFVRLAPRDREIRVSTPVEEPQMVAIFHESLLRDPGVQAGLQPGGTLVANSRSSPEELRSLYGLGVATVATIDALHIALGEHSHINSAMLGAVVRAAGFLEAEAVRRALARIVAVRGHSEEVEANLRTFDRGYDEVRWHTQAGKERRGLPKPSPRLGYANASIGGVIFTPGNSIVRDWSVSRQGYIPELLEEKCTHCGLCDMVCPDLCFVWAEGEDAKGRAAMRLMGIDYRYCKGCLKCIEACPPEALVKREDEPDFVRDRRVPLYLGLP